MTSPGEPTTFRAHRDGRILQADAALAAMLGADSPDALVDRSVADLFADAEEGRWLLQELQAHHTVAPREVRLSVPDGRAAWVDFDARVVEGGADGGVIEGRLSGPRDRTLAEQRLAVAAEERRELLARLFRVQEEERSRMAGEIHDDPLQLLAAAQIDLSGLVEKVEGTDLEGRVVRVRDRLDEAAARLRRILLGLRPVALDAAGLVEAVRGVAGDLLGGDHVAWSVEGTSGVEPPPETRTVLFRIAQEALANVRKHAHAHTVTVTVFPMDDGFALRVRDDGAGFSREDVNRAQVGHLGLRSMRERAESAGGWMRMESAPGAGTTLDVWVPGAPA